MNKPKFTPGPWAVSISGLRGSFTVSSPEMQKHEADNTEDGVDGYTVSSANRNLIAAAPEMYEALKALYVGPSSAKDEPERRVSMNVSRNAFKKMEAAITKAEGSAV